MSIVQTIPKIAAAIRKDNLNFDMVISSSSWVYGTQSARRIA